MRSLGDGSCSSVEVRPVLEHSMHDHGKLAGECDGGALEPDPLLQIESPGSQAAFHAASREQDDRCLIKAASHLGIAPSRDMAIIINFS